MFIMANCHTNCRFDWKIAGIAIGYAIMTFSIGQIAFFVCLISFYGSEIFYIVTLWIFVFNSLATIMWLSGIAKNMIRLMLASLIWWGISLCLWLRFICLVTHNLKSEDSHRLVVLYALTGCCVALYILAVISYRSLEGVIDCKRLEAMRLAV